MAKKEYEVKVKTDEKSLTNTYGKFIIQPLERGYGVTVGNALRRVLMTTLPGAAITNVKVEGVLHEFSTISGIKDDMSDIIQNLKLKIQNKYSTKNCNFIDGIRVDLDVGWFLIRASNTENSLILRIDGNTKENFVNLSKEVDALLKSEKIIVNDISQV